MSDIIIHVHNTYYNSHRQQHDHCDLDHGKPVQKGYISAISFFENGVLINSIKGKLNIMGFTLKDTQNASFPLIFVDKKGATSDAASVELQVANAEQGSATYDDPTNTVTFAAGVPGVTALKIIAKDSAGNVLPFDDIAVQVNAGDAVSGSIGEVTLSDQA